MLIEITELVAIQLQNSLGSTSYALCFNTHLDVSIVSWTTMNSPSAQFVTSRRMSAYEPIHQMSMWGESFMSNGNLNASASMIMDADTKLDNQVKVLKLVIFVFVSWSHISQFSKLSCY